MKWFKRLFCKHMYGEAKHYMYDSGMSKFFVETCEKCERKKVYFL